MLHAPYFSRVSVHRRLQLTGQKAGVGAYTDMSFACIARIIKKGGWALTRENTVLMCIITWGVSVLTE